MTTAAGALSGAILERVGGLMREVAAEELIPRHRALAAHEIDRKAGGSLVTVADLAAERRLEAGLTGLLVGSTAVGEEAVEQDSSVWDRIDQVDRPVWIIDPLDGTSNFADGADVFAMIVALAVSGRTVAGWLYAPLQDRLAVAELGGGTWLDGARCRIDPPARLGELHGGWNLGPFDEVRRQEIRARRDRFASIRNLKCAGHEYLRLLTGQLHFRLFGKIKPWDHAAGVLLHAEAGGHARLLDGRDYAPTCRTGALLLAPDRARLDRLGRFFEDPESLDR